MKTPENPCRQTIFFPLVPGKRKNAVFFTLLGALDSDQVNDNFIFLLLSNALEDRGGSAVLIGSCCAHPVRLLAFSHCNSDTRYVPVCILPKPHSGGRGCGPLIFIVHVFRSEVPRGSMRLPPAHTVLTESVCNYSTSDGSPRPLTENLRRGDACLVFSTAVCLPPAHNSS